MKGTDSGNLFSLILPGIFQHFCSLPEEYNRDPDGRNKAYLGVWYLRVGNILMQTQLAI